MLSFINFKLEQICSSEAVVAAIVHISLKTIHRSERNMNITYPTQTLKWVTNDKLSLVQRDIAFIIKIAIAYMLIFTAV